MIAGVTHGDRAGLTRAGQFSDGKFQLLVNLEFPGPGLGISPIGSIGNERHISAVSNTDGPLPRGAASESAPGTVRHVTISGCVMSSASNHQVPSTTWQLFVSAEKKGGFEFYLVTNNRIKKLKIFLAHVNAISLS